jgi:hypothetical protein
MILKKNEEKSKEEEKDFIKVSQKIDEIIYDLKIYFSKDKQSIIFKIEQENIQTYYYYEKYQIFELKNNHKRFNNLNTLTDIYQNIKSIVDKSIPKFEIESLNKIKVSFANKSETIFELTLRKKVLCQNRLNALIITQLEENKSKIKSIKKNASKIEKSIKEQNDIINDINTKIEEIDEKIENVIKEIDTIKNSVKNITPINQNKHDKCDDKKNKNKNNKESKDNNHKNKNIPEINNTTNKSCSKIYEIIFILNLVIIVLIAYIFFKLGKIEEKEQLEKQKLEKLKKKFSFLNYVNNMNEEELSYIDKTFKTGVIFERENAIEEDKSNNNNKEEIEIKEQSKKDIYINKKLIEEKKKSKLKEDKSENEDIGVFNINFENQE